MLLNNIQQYLRYILSKWNEYFIRMCRKTTQTFPNGTISFFDWLSAESSDELRHNAHIILPLFTKLRSCFHTQLKFSYKRFSWVRVHHYVYIIILEENFCGGESHISFPNPRKTFILTDSGKFNFISTYYHSVIV